MYRTHWCLPKVDLDVYSWAGCRFSQYVDRTKPHNSMLSEYRYNNPCICTLLCNQVWHIVRSKHRPISGSAASPWFLTRRTCHQLLENGDELWITIGTRTSEHKQFHSFAYSHATSPLPSVEKQTGSEDAMWRSHSRREVTNATSRCARKTPAGRYNGEEVIGCFLTLVEAPSANNKMKL